MTDRYSKLGENVELRKHWCVKAGLGFDLPTLRNPGRPAPNVASVTKLTRAAFAESEPVAPPYVALPDDLDPFFYQQEA